MTLSSNIIKLNDKKLNHRLTEAEERKTATVDRQETSIAEVRELVQENNRLLVVANNVSSRISDTLRLQWLRNLGDELLSVVRKSFTMNLAVYKAVMSMQGLLPSHLERSLIQEPFILEDAIGRLSPVHLQFISSWEAFEAVLEDRFRGHKGHEKVLQRAYALQELATGREISRQLPWVSAFLPGQKVGMDMIFRNLGGGTATSCPSCKTRGESAMNISVKWLVTIFPFSRDEMLIIKV